MHPGCTPSTCNHPATARTPASIKSQDRLQPAPLLGLRHVDQSARHPPAPPGSPGSGCTPCNRPATASEALQASSARTATTAPPLGLRRVDQTGAQPLSSRSGTGCISRRGVQPWVQPPSPSRGPTGRNRERGRGTGSGAMPGNPKETQPSRPRRGFPFLGKAGATAVEDLTKLHPRWGPMAIQDRVKSLKGLWNPFKVGWVFPTKREATAEVREALQGQPERPAVGATTTRGAGLKRTPKAQAKVNDRSVTAPAKVEAKLGSRASIRPSRGWSSSSAPGASSPSRPGSAPRPTLGQAALRGGPQDVTRRRARPSKTCSSFWSIISARDQSLRGPVR